MTVKKEVKVFLIIVALLTMTGCFLLFPPLPLTPPIGRDLPSNFKEADLVFKKRVKETFSHGIDHDNIKLMLEKQGFSIRFSDGWWLALFEKESFSCTLIWKISWSENDTGRLEDIKASYGGACL